MKRLPNGLLEKGSQSRSKCVPSIDDIKRMLSYHQQNNTIYQYFRNERQEITTKCRTYTTDSSKQKKLNQKSVINIRNITGVKPESETKSNKIILQDESTQIIDKPVNTEDQHQVQNMAQSIAASKESATLKTNSQPQPVTSSSSSQCVEPKRSLHPISLKSDLQLINQKPSFQQEKYADLSLLSAHPIPIPLHQRDISLVGATLADDLDRFQYHMMTAVHRVNEQGKLCYVSAKKILEDPNLRETINSNLTAQSISNKMSVLLTENDVGKNFEKAVEKAKEISKTATEVGVDKAKALLASLKEKLDKLKKKD